MGVGRVPARSATRDREQHERARHEAGSPTRNPAQEPSPQMHLDCFDRNKVSGYTRTGEASPDSSVGNLGRRLVLTR